MNDWLGDNPVYLVVWVPDDRGATVIDLDEHGWSAKYKDLMREPGKWYLVEKRTGRVPIAIVVRAGDQPFYTAKHVGIASGVPDAEGNMPATEAVAYGLGRKLTDGHVESVWYFTNGLCVTGALDAEAFGIESIKKGLA